MSKKLTLFFAFALIAIGCFVLVSCNNLWKIEETTDISFSVNVQQVLSTYSSTSTTFKTDARNDAPIEVTATASLYYVGDNSPFRNSNQNKTK